MLESAVLLKEIIKTSDHSAAWVVVLKGICRISKNAACPFMSLSHLDVPDFSLITSFSQNKQLIWGVCARNICPFSMNTFGARLILIVSPVRTFMNISISNILK
jgi:hypothetical protein